MTHAEDSETSSFFTAVELSGKEEKMSLLKSVSLRGISYASENNRMEEIKAIRTSFYGIKYAHIKRGGKDGLLQTVTWQEDDCCPLDPCTLLVLYEEDCTVKQVASAFDAFLIGSRGVNFAPIPNDQMNKEQEEFKSGSTGAASIQHSSMSTASIQSW
eukprot:12948556-Ditylum_brightwellii.AAC.1